MAGGEGVFIDLALFVPENQPVDPREDWLPRLDPDLSQLLKDSAEERRLSRFQAYISHLDESAIELIEEYEQEHGSLPYVHALRLSDSLCRPPVAPPTDSNPIVKKIYESRLKEYTAPELILDSDLSNAPAIKSLLDWIQENYLDIEKLAALAADTSEDTK